MLIQHKGIGIILSSVLLNPITTFSQPAPIKTPYNIILIINDQETYKLADAQGYRLPAREAFKQRGLTFQNHYTAAAMCSPSRATFLTGTPPQKNGVFDQMEYNFVPELNPKIPNMGSVLHDAGYQTAYFGKFEMAKEPLINVKDTINYSTHVKAYGFDVFNAEGDVGGQTQQGYQDDAYFAGEAIRWLRTNQSSTNKSKKPFFMVVSLLNPHDIMYADANVPNSPKIQKAAAPVIALPPKNTIYESKWQFSLPDTLHESLTAPGMPPALLEYQNGWAGTFGFIPTEQTAMWHSFYNYYLNTIRDSDNNLQQIVNAMNEMNLWENTIVIVTADHGEMGGSHGGLRGKGPMAYEENSHIPLIIAHPTGAHNQSTVALTSHLDLLPTLIGLAGAKNSHPLAGHDFSELLINSAKRKDIHAIRPAVLFNYVGVSTVDAPFLIKKLLAGYKLASQPSLTEINLNKRGFLSFVFDGRYKLARYYAPNAFNVPLNSEQLFKDNDVQLFDLVTDPTEKHNLALEPEKYKMILIKMNQLLNDLMAKEVGINDGGFLPESIRPHS